MPPNSEKMFPNLSEEEQDVELEPVVMGPPAYGSPDPATAENTLLPLVDDPHHTAADAADEAAKLREEESAEKRKAGTWKEMVEGAESLEALEALEKEYEEAGADFSTVEDAFDKKREELEAANSNDNGS